MSSAPRSFQGREVKLSKDRLNLAREADNLVNKTLSTKKLYDKVWQMPVVLAPVSEKGDQECIILRPVDSQEAMTAAFSRLPKAAVADMAKKIQKLEGIEHVFYDLTNKPPGTIEWE